MTVFFLMNAIFFGVIALVFTLKFFFSSIRSNIAVILWIGSFLWFSYCISRLVA